MWPENIETSKFDIDHISMELFNIDNAIKNPEIGRLLKQYSQDVSNHVVKAQLEAGLKKLTPSGAGTCLTLLSPKPAFVIKALAQAPDRGLEKKIFINVCTEEKLSKPASQKAIDGASGMPGVKWSIPHSLTRPRKDLDKSGETCLVYDVIFHPDALVLADKNQSMRSLIHETALEAAETSSGLKINRKKIRYPKLKFKGTLYPTVISRPEDPVGPSPSQDGFKEPKYTIRYRNTSLVVDRSENDDERQFVIDSNRPIEMVVEVSLPEMSSAKTVELDVEEKKMTLESIQPEKYRLVLNFAFPVDEEKGSAKFDKSTHKLIVTLPVKSYDTGRHPSTDSGIDIDCENSDENNIMDTAYRTQAKSENLESKKSSEVCQKAGGLAFPGYACNVYDELMVLKLDVKNVEEESVEKSTIKSEEGTGFSLKFKASCSGETLSYGFDMIFVFKNEDSYSLDDIEVEIWDNNIIVQMALPMIECNSYLVGNDSSNMTKHMLPQLRAYKQKRKEQMRTNLSSNNVSLPENSGNEKERHNSGDSAFSVSDSESTSIKDDKISEKPEQKSAETLATGMPHPVRGILKKNGIRGRCFSESGADQFRLHSSPSLSSCISVESSIPEEQDEDDDVINAEQGTSISSKKSVRFSEIVHRQVFRSNASILGQRLKNIKKADQKRRALERRLSEGDAHIFEGTSPAMCKTGSWMGVKMEEDNETSKPFDDDSGVASSCEDWGSLGKAKGSGKRGWGKKSNQTKKKPNCQGEKGSQNSDLMFDFDM